MPNTLTFSFPHKPDKDLGANSRANWHVKYRKLKVDKNTGWAFTQAALAESGLTPGEFLTGGGLYPVDDALPVQVLFRRFYTGTGKQWDELNILCCYKGFEDGISRALATDDKHFHTTAEQIRVKGEARLEVVIAPAWTIKEGGRAA